MFSKEIFNTESGYKLIFARNASLAVLPDSNRNDRKKRLDGNIEYFKNKKIFL